MADEMKKGGELVVIVLIKETFEQLRGIAHKHYASRRFTTGDMISMALGEFIDRHENPQDKPKDESPPRRGCVMK